MHERGISIVICCYNSSSRISATLSHLVSQQVPDDLAWEIVLVDNSSTDNTVEVAIKSWPSGAGCPLRVVHEPSPGQSNARRRGILEARYSYISFIDDDNSVCNTWVRTVVNILDTQPDIGACGGLIIAAPETTPPTWFHKFQHFYAVGHQDEQKADITQLGKGLWGAGLTVRRKAYDELIDSGFKPLLVGRRGRALSSGDDTELCLAIRIKLWRIHYDPQLTLRHFIPASRLNWDYVRAVVYGSGAASTSLDSYVCVERVRRGEDLSLKYTWLYQAGSIVKSLLSHPIRLIRRVVGPPSYTSDSLDIEYLLGRLSSLLVSRGSYRRSIQESIEKWQT